MAVSSPTSRPGPKSLELLAWLVRVGASPDEPLAIVGGCTQRMVRDHVARLAREGYVRRVPMTRGEGSLVVATQKGALRVGESRFGAPRSVAPSTWAHHKACAWVAASLEEQGLVWIGPREIPLDDYWRDPVSYEDSSGGTRRVQHRPDLGYLVGSEGVAIEVELQRKSRARMLGILRMYADRTMGVDPTLKRVVYVTGNPDVAQLVVRTANRIGMTDRVIQLKTLAGVIQLTRERVAS
jgi:hypothetical protein